METLAEYSVEDMLPFIPNGKYTAVIDGKEYHIRVGSTRLRCFKRSLECVGCGVVGEIFRLECQMNEDNEVRETPHLNLYAPAKHGYHDAEWVLMTQDHILPRSKGGKSCLSNLATMCVKCNGLKGSQ